MTSPRWSIRRARPDDHAEIVRRLDQWWGGRTMSGLLQPLFLENFSGTSLVANSQAGQLAGFLIGFVSEDDPRIAYVHFVGVAPEERGKGLARHLYSQFADLVAARGVRKVRCVTSVVNVESVRFHESIGFTVDGRTEEPGVDGGGYVQMSRAVSPAPSQERPQAMWPPDSDVVLVGADVEVRPTNVSDSEGLFNALDAAEVWQHLTVRRPTSLSDMRSLVEHSIAVMHPWTVRLRQPINGWEDGSIVGWSSFLEVSASDARLEIGATAYAPSLWASTVNPETKLLLLGYAFDTLQFSRVQLKTDVRNERSQDAITRLGAVREGLLRSYQRRRDGSIRDTVLFSVTANEWPQVREGLRARLTTPSG